MKGRNLRLVSRLGVAAFSALFVLLSFSGPAFAFSSLNGCLKSAECATTLGFAPRTALSSVGSNVIGFPVSATTSATSTVAAGSAAGSVTAAQGTAVSSVAWHAAGAGVLAGGALAVANTSYLDADSMDAIRKKAYEARCAADPTTCLFWREPYLDVADDPGGRNGGTGRSTLGQLTARALRFYTPQQLQSSQSRVFDSWWGSHYALFNAASTVPERSYNQFAVTPFANDFQWSALSDSVRTGIIDWTIANRWDLIGDGIKTKETLRIPVAPGSTLRVSSPGTGILELPTGTVVGNPYTRQAPPVVIPDPPASPTPNPPTSPTPNPPPSPTPTPPPSPTPTPPPSPTPTPPPSPAPTPSPTPSPPPGPSPTPEPPLVPPSTSSEPLAPAQFTKPNFVSYAFERFSDRFPLDVWGSLPSGGDLSACPNLEFFGKQFQLCFIRDALSLLRIPVVIAFIMWAVVNL